MNAYIYSSAKLSQSDAKKKAPGGGVDLFIDLQHLMKIKKKKKLALSQSSHSSQNSIALKVQWNLVITRTLGPWKLHCYNKFLISG